MKKRRGEKEGKGGGTSRCDHLFCSVSPRMSPASPDRVHPVEPRNLNDEFNICVVVIVRPPRDIDDFVPHAYVLCVRPEVLGGGHHDEEDGALVAEGVVGPLTDGTDALDGADTIVSDEDFVNYLLFGSAKLRDVRGDGGEDPVVVDRGGGGGGGHFGWSSLGCGVGIGGLRWVVVFWCLDVWVR